MMKKEKTAKSEAVLEREARQLRRLEMLVDIVFGLMIIRIFLLLPNPSSLKLTEGRHLLDELAPHADSFAVILIGLILIILYWGQNNTQFGNLERTDGRHAAMNILSLFFLLLYLYFVRLGESEFKDDVDALAMQSISLAIAGFISAGAWMYASKNRRLLSAALTEREAKERTIGFLVEPIVALFSLFFAFVSPIAWTLSWLAAIPLGWLLRRRLPKEEAELEAQG